MSHDLILKLWPRSTEVNGISPEVCLLGSCSKNANGTAIAVRPDMVAFCRLQTGCKHVDCLKLMDLVKVSAGGDTTLVPKGP